MPLSEHEQRILDEIEARLAAEDPKFARTTAVATPRGSAVRRLRRAVTGFFSGLALLIAGLIAGLDNSNVLVAFGFAGFVVMLLAVLVSVKAWRDLGPATKQQRPTWLERMEERWKKRYDGDDRH